MLSRWLVWGPVAPNLMQTIFPKARWRFCELRSFSFICLLEQHCIVAVNVPNINCNLKIIWLIKPVPTPNYIFRYQRIFHLWNVEVIGTYDLSTFYFHSLRESERKNVGFTLYMFSFCFPSNATLPARYSIILEITVFTDCHLTTPLVQMSFFGFSHFQWLVFILSYGEIEKRISF